MMILDVRVMCCTVGSDSELCNVIGDYPVWLFPDQK